MATLAELLREGEDDAIGGFLAPLFEVFLAARDRPESSHCTLCFRRALEAELAKVIEGKALQEVASVWGFQAQLEA